MMKDNLKRQHDSLRAYPFKPCSQTKMRAWVKCRGLVFWVGLSLCFSLFTAPVAQAGKSKPPTLAVSEKRSLDFGTVAGSSDGSSSIVLSPSGAVTTTGYGIVIKDRLQVGKYEVRGPKYAQVLITLPSTVTLSSGSSQATLSNFTSWPSGAGVLNDHGKLTIKVGATLSIPTGQAGGAYTGPMTIYVDFQ